MGSLSAARVKAAQPCVGFSPHVSFLLFRVTPGISNCLFIHQCSLTIGLFINNSIVATQQERGRDEKVGASTLRHVDRREVETKG